MPLSHEIFETFSRLKNQIILSRFASIDEESTLLLYAFEYELPTTVWQHDHPLGDLGLLYGD